jgi:hypothetical protein
MKQFLISFLLAVSISSIQAQETVYFKKDDSKKSSARKNISSPSNIIKISPLSFIVGVIPIYYERAITNTFAIQAGLGITTKNYIRTAFLSAQRSNLGTVKTKWSDGTDNTYSSLTTFDGNDYRANKIGYFFAAEPRVYLNDEGLEGGFIGFSMSRANYKFTHTRINPGSNVLTFGSNTFSEYENINDFLVTFGSQTLYDKVSLEYNAGVGLRTIEGKYYAYGNDNSGKFIEGESTNKRTGISVSLTLKLGYHF